MAPELLRGAPPNAASDLYSVGMLFHQMLTGTSPPPAASMTAMLNRILGEDDAAAAELPAFDFDAAFSADGAVKPVRPSSAPGPADLPAPLRPIVSKLCAAAPADRYADARVVLRELAAAVGSDLPVETAATRESFLRANVLIGRDNELALLATALARAKRGSGRAFLISGESGVGKSRLTAELRTLALVHGCWVAEGQSVTEGGYYYQEWLPLLRALCFRSDMTDAEASVLKDLIGDIDELLGRPIADPPAVQPDAAQARVVATVVALLARQPKPVTMILEDLQWARSESVALLAELSAHAAQLPILLVATQRSDEGSQRAQALPDLQLIPLGRLKENKIAELSASMLGAVGQRPELVAYLARQTEGNVFFLIETVRALAENAGELQRIGQGELPESVFTSGIERIVERRLEQVSADYRPLLEFAATLGRKLDLPVLEHAFPLTPLRPFLIACANAAVLESQGVEWRFAHNKLRENLLQRMAAGRSRLLHEKVAYAIEASYSGAALEAMAAALAYHFQQAEIFDKALAYYVQAGDTAAKLYLLEEARAHYRAAKVAIDRLPVTTELQRLHVDILLKKVNAGLTNDSSQAQVERLNEAREVLETLLRSGESVPADRLRMARVDYYCGRAFHYGGQPREAIRYYQRVLPVAQEFADRELMLMPSYVIGMALCMQGQFGKARDMLGQVMDPLFATLGVSRDTIRCALYYSVALSATGQCQKANGALERVRKWVAQPEQASHRSIFLTLQATAAIVMADWPMVLNSTEQILQIADQNKEAIASIAALDCSAWAYSYLGRHGQAIENRTRAAELRRTLGGAIIADWFAAAEAEILFNAGSTEEALQKARTLATSSREAGLPYSHAIAERVWGCALGRLGAELLEVEAHFVTSIALSEHTEQVLNAAQTQLWWGRIFCERGEPARAAPHFALALSQIEAGGCAYALQTARRIVNEAGY